MGPFALRRSVVVAAVAALAITSAASSTEASAKAAQPPALSAGTAEGLTITPTNGVIGVDKVGRVLDTRQTGGALPAWGSRKVAVSGRVGQVAAVWANVTAVTPKAAGYFTTWASGQPQPATSNVNFKAGATVANLSLIPVGADGSIMVRNGSGGSAHLLVDIQGYVTKGVVTAAGAVKPLAPARLLDTRVSTAVGAGKDVVVQVAGRGGIPASNVGAVALNVTVTRAIRAGWLLAYPSGTTMPLASSLNFVASENRASFTTVKVGADGKVKIRNGSTGTVHIVADAFGWSPAGDTTMTPAGLIPVTPKRVIDTRSTTPVAAGHERLVPLGVVPDGASAALVNLTAVSPSAAGWALAHEDSTDLTRSSLNFVAGQAVNNVAVVPLGVSGWGSDVIYVRNGSKGSLNVIVDIVGWVGSRNVINAHVVRSTDGTPVSQASVYATGRGTAPLTNAQGDVVWHHNPTVATANLCTRPPAPTDDSDAGLVRECFDSNAADASYDTVPFSLGTTLNYTAALDLGIRIRGTVTSTDGQTVTDALVLSRRMKTVNDWEAAGSRSTSNGTFDMYGLKPGKHAVAVIRARHWDDAKPPTIYAPEWFDDLPGNGATQKPPPLGAVRFDLSPGAVQTVNLSVDPTSRIWGTVTNSAGPVAQARVTLRHTSGVTFDAFTAADGRYGVPVLHGTWTVCFGTSTLPDQTCWESKGSVADATPITLAAGETRTGIDGVLP